MLHHFLGLQQLNHNFHSGALQAAAMSANTDHSQSGRFNGIWVKLASDSLVWPPSFWLSSKHTQMDALTFQFSHFALKLFGCVACAVVAPTVLPLLLCTFTDLGLSYPHRRNGSNFTPKNMFNLKNIFLLVQMNLVSLQHISSSDYNNPADSIVVLLKKICNSSCLHSPTPLTSTMS